VVKRSNYINLGHKNDVAVNDILVDCLLTFRFLLDLLTFLRQLLGYCMRLTVRKDALPVAQSTKRIFFLHCDCGLYLKTRIRSVEHGICPIAGVCTALFYCRDVKP